MDSVFILDTVTTFFFALATLTLVLGKTERLDFPSRLFLLLSLGTYVFVGLSNMLEHGGITSRLDLFEDYAETLFPLFFPFFVYSVITEQEMERAVNAGALLRDGELKYRALVESTAAIPWEMDLATMRFNYVGPQAAKVLGYPSPQWTDFEFWAGLVHPEDREAAVRSRKQPVEEGKSHEFEYRMLSADRRVVWIRDIVSVFPGQGSSGVLRGFLFDVTDRKIAETELRESEQRYRNLFENSYAAMLIVDAHTGTVSDVNPAACTYYGYPKETFMGMNIAAIEVVGNDRAEGEQRGKDGVSGSYSEFRHRLSGGRLRDVEVYSGPILIRGKQFLFVIVHDITERKEMEARVHASLKEKEILLREIHHRVKNNFQVITSLLRLQSGVVKDDKLVAMFKEAEQRIKAMAMVHDRLYLSDNLAAIDAREYLQSLVGDLLRSSGRLGAVSATVRAEPLALSVETAIPCGLVVNELVSNAFKYAFPQNASGTLQVDLKGASPEADGSIYCTLTVRDDGVGLPAGLDMETQDSLGLRLVGTLVTRQLGGTVMLEREGGTCFTIRFANRTTQRGSGNG